MILLFAVDIQRGAIAVSDKGQVYPFTFRRAVIKGIVRYACFRDADLAGLVPLIQFDLAFAAGYEHGVCSYHEDFHQLHSG